MTVRPEIPAWWTLRHVCLRCWSGHHAECLGFPDGGEFSRGDKSKPCQCAKHDHQGGRGLCTDWRYRDWSLVTCNRPAKGTWIEKGPGGVEVEVERCGIHLAGLRRQAENDAKHRAEMDALSKRWENERTNRRAANDWADRFRREFGLDASPVTSDTAPLIAMHAEQLYGLLKEAVIEMDAVGIEHGFHGTEEEADDA